MMSRSTVIVVPSPALRCWQQSYPFIDNSDQIGFLNRVSSGNTKMRLTLAQLETFFWTAQLGSAQRAAQHLNLAQPTVSLRLKELQEAMGASLLERTSRGLS